MKAIPARSSAALRAGGRGWARTPRRSGRRRPLRRSPPAHERVAQVGRCRIGTRQHDALLAHVAEAVGDRYGQVLVRHVVHPDRRRAQGVRRGRTDGGDAKAIRQRMAVRREPGGQRFGAVRAGQDQPAGPVQRLQHGVELGGGRGRIDGHRGNDHGREAASAQQAGEVIGLRRRAGDEDAVAHASRIREATRLTTASASSAGPEASARR